MLKTRTGRIGSSVVASLVVFGVITVGAATPATAGPSYWHVVPSANTTSSINTLGAVSCGSALSCVAVGVRGAYGLDGQEFGGTIIESWTGTRWRLVSSPTEATGALGSVSCTSASFCVAVGKVETNANTGAAQTLVESWNGTTWSVVPSPNSVATDNRLNAVSCISTTLCTAVGFDGNPAAGDGSTLVESWNGTAWSIVPSPNTGGPVDDLSAISCLSTTWCTAVGHYFVPTNDQRTLVETWNGTAWSVVPSPNHGTYDGLAGISCVSRTACMAVGQDETSQLGVIESWNGTAWSVVPSVGPKVAGLSDVSCVSARSCQAVGSGVSGSLTVTRVESWNGTAWSLLPSGNATTSDGATDNELSGISCISTTSCKAVGAYGIAVDGGGSGSTLAESFG